MRLRPVPHKASKFAICLVGFASACLCRCVDFAPDAAPTSRAGDGVGGGTNKACGGCGNAGDAAAGELAGRTAQSGSAESAGESGSTGESGSAGSALTAGASGSMGDDEQPLSISPERSVLEGNPDALEYFSLNHVLESATGDIAEDVYRTYALSFAERSESEPQPGPRCDDAQPASHGLSTLNGFALPCPAEAANLYWQLPAWKPLAATNRFDLAPAGGENCGEQHLSFFFDTSFSGQPEFPVRAYLNFVALIANPAPELGLDGCRPLLDFWASLNRPEYDAPTRRARAFEIAFLGGSMIGSSAQASRELARLLSAGMAPLISPRHFGYRGRLQLLYLGDRGEWHFFEHALLSEKEHLVERLPLTQSIAVSALLEEHPKREQCIKGLLSSIPSLLSEDPNLMRLGVGSECFAATNSTTETTLSAGVLTAPLGPDLRERLDEYLADNYPELGLTGLAIAHRATFAGTCAGCHVVGDSPWSNAHNVSHVSRDFMQACASSGPDATRRCYARSTVLNTLFIPHWTSVLDEFLRHPGTYGPLPGGESSVTAIDGAPLAASR